MKQIASPGSMHETGCLGLVHWDDPVGWDGEGGGRGVQDGEHMYNTADALHCTAETNTKQLHYNLKKIHHLENLGALPK